MASTRFMKVVSDKEASEYGEIKEMQEICLVSRNVQCRCPKCGKTHYLKFLMMGLGKTLFSIKDLFPMENFAGGV